MASLVVTGDVLVGSDGAPGVLGDAAGDRATVLAVLSLLILAPLLCFRHMAWHAAACCPAAACCAAVLLLLTHVASRCSTPVNAGTPLACWAPLLWPWPRPPWLLALRWR